MLDIPNERIVHLDETVVTIIRYTITAKSAILQEITGIDIRVCRRIRIWAHPRIP